jgi:multiple antibiotic resistance protein
VSKEWLSYFVFTVTSLFTIVNPLGAMPFYSSITEGATREIARSIALRASVAALLAMVFFAFSGKFVFSFFNVSVDGLRVVGGILFFIMGYDMLQGKDSRTKTVSASEKFNIQDIATKAITPLAIPLICGPGTITVVTVMMQESNYTWQRLTLVFAQILVSFFTFLILVSAKRITQFLGESGQKVFYRLMGLILMMIAVEYFFNGIRPYIRSLWQV